MGKAGGGVTAHHLAVLAAAALAAFIAGVAIASVACWFGRDRIRAAAIRRRR